MKLEISTWSITKIFLVILAFWVVWQIRTIVALLFVVLILVAALQQTVTWLVARRIPRVLAVSLVMTTILAALVLTLAAVIPALVTQLQVFVSDQFPDLLEQLTPYYTSITQGQQLLTDLLRQLQQVSGNVLSGIISIFGGLLSALTVMVLSFYLLLEEHPFTQAGINLLPASRRNQVTASYQRITEKLGAWLRGQFLLSLIIGVLTALAMTIIGLPAPLAIGVLAGLLEIVPIIGPLITGIVILVMAAISPEDAAIKAVAALIFFLVLQILESQILVPKIMQQAIGLSPVIVIVTLLVGAQLGGIAGAILAIPLAAIMQVVAQDWPKLTASIRS